LKINKRKRRKLKKQKQALFSVGLSPMILTKLRFENQQKKTPQANKNKSKLYFGQDYLR